MRQPDRPPMGRASIGTAVVLMALGAVIAFAVDPPDEVTDYVDVLDLGLILVWSGILILIMAVVMHRRPRPRSGRRDRATYSTYNDNGTYDRSTYDDQRDDQTGHDVHRPGWAGDTQRYPTIRDR